MSPIQPSLGPLASLRIPQHYKLILLAIETKSVCPEFKKAVTIILVLLSLLLLRQSSSSSLREMRLGTGWVLPFIISFSDRGRREGERKRKREREREG